MLFIIFIMVLVVILTPGTRREHFGKNENGVVASLKLWIIGVCVTGISKFYV